MDSDSIFISKAIEIIKAPIIQTISAQELSKAIHRQDPLLETYLLSEFGKRFNYSIYEEFSPENDILQTQKYISHISWACKNSICLGLSPKKVLEVAVWNPFTINEQETLRQKISHPIKWKLASWSYIQMVWTHVLRQNSNSKKNTWNHSGSGEQTRIYGQKSHKALREITEEALKLNASDIHFISYKTYVDITFRINGMITPWARISKKEYQEIWNTCHLLAKASPSPTPFRDLKFVLQTSKQALPLRFSSINSISGKSSVLRLLTERYLKGYAHLGFFPEQIQQIERLLKKRNGLILICGPTGSGKSTTAYNFLIDLTQKLKKVISIEDPIEIQLPDTTQINISPEQNFSYQDAIRASLRQNPDVIYIGEIRDRETAKLCFHAANSGHLVITTFHSSEIRHCKKRLQHLGVSEELFQKTLITAIFQRLTPQYQVHEDRASYSQSDALPNSERRLTATIYTPAPPSRRTFTDVET